MILADIERQSIVEANPAASHFLGYTAEELKGLNIADLFQDGSSDKLLSMLPEIQRSIA